MTVLVITGEFDQYEAARRARRVGADGVLLKPFNATRLCDKIDELLRARSPPDDTEHFQSES